MGTFKAHYFSVLGSSGLTNLKSLFLGPLLILLCHSETSRLPHFFEPGLTAHASFDLQASFPTSERGKSTATDPDGGIRGLDGFSAPVECGPEPTYVNFISSVKDTES